MDTGQGVEELCPSIHADYYRDICDRFLGHFTRHIPNYDESRQGCGRGSTAVKGDVLVDVIPERVQEFYINSWD